MWEDRTLVAEEGRGTGDWGGVWGSEVVSRPLSTLRGEGGAKGSTAPPPHPAAVAPPTPNTLRSRCRRAVVLPMAVKLLNVRVSWWWGEGKGVIKVRLQSGCCSGVPVVSAVMGMGRHTLAPSTCGDVDEEAAVPCGGASAGTDSDLQCFFLGGVSKARMA